MTAARPSRARRSRMASATARGRREAHHGPAREDLDAQATAGEDPRARALRGAPPPQLVRGPAEEVRQGHLRLLDLRVPALLPLEGDPAVVARRGQPLEDASGREVAAAGQDRGPGDLPVRRAPRVLEVDVAQEGPERRRAGLGLLAELGEGVGRVPHRAEPLAPRLLQEGAGRGARSRSRRASRARPRRRCRGGGRAGRRGPRRSSPASRRDRRPAARGRRRRGCRAPPGARRRSAVRSASSTASAARGGVGAVEEGARVDAGDGEAGVGEAGERLPEAGARELGPGPEGVVALDEAQLDAVVAEPRGASRTRASGQDGHPSVEKASLIMSSAPACAG